MISKMSKWVFPIIILFILHNAISQEYKNLYSYKDNKPLYDMDGLPIWAHPFFGHNFVIRENS